MIQSNVIIKQLKEKIAGFNAAATVEKVGTVLEVGDGIAQVSGLREVGSMEMLDFGDGVFGVALNLEENTIGSIILGDFLKALYIIVPTINNMSIGINCVSCNNA